MKWGLVALNGEIASLPALKRQIARYSECADFSKVMGVDGGCELLVALNTPPDIVLGDFDSIHDLSRYKDLWPKASFQTFPAEKDYTDAELAFETMLQFDLDRIMVVGAFGGRADHMLSVISLVGHHSKFVLVDELNYIEKFNGPFEKCLKKNEHNKAYVSLLPVQDRLTGITLTGFKYPLTDATIVKPQTVGISNEIKAEFAVIRVAEGAGFLSISKDRAMLDQD